jgi:hypothetical protein
VYITFRRQKISFFSAEVAYYHIVEEWMKGPQLMSKKGRAIWTGM